jgi:hypothetical protein
MRGQRIGHHGTDIMPGQHELRDAEMIGEFDDIGRDPERVITCVGARAVA